MLTFDNDDNDDNLSLENSQRSSGAPQRPAATPFGKPASKDTVHPANSAPVMLPPKSPFGSPPKRPDVTLPVVTKSVLPPRKPLPSKQEASIEPIEQPDTSTQENYLLELMNRKSPSSSLSNLPKLPPTSAQTPSVPQQGYNPNQQNPVPQQGYNPNQQNPEPQQGYNPNQQNPAPQQGYNPNQQNPAPQQGYNPNQQNPAPQQGYNPNQQNPAPQQQKKVKNQRKEKTPKPVKVIREKTYDGERKKILTLRIVAGTVATIIGLAGLNAIFLPNNGPTQAQVRAAAQDSVNYTGFPTISGEQFSLDFARAYFNFSSNADDRKDKLLVFASDDLVKQIDIQVISAAEYDLTKTAESLPYADYIVSQTISYGPYVVTTNNLDATHAVFTVKVGLDSGAVLYMEVPVKYNASDYSLILAGPPSFVKPLQNQGATEVADYTVNFGSGDEKIQDDFSSDLSAYLRAWATSDSTIIDRYTLSSATDNAKLGLQSSVVFHELSSFIVEPADEANPKTATQRRAEVVVIWEDPTTGVRYPQQYRILLGLNQENTWSVYDIENFAILN